MSVYYKEKQQPETVIRRQITDALRWDGYFVFYVLQTLGSYPGVSDLIAVKGGKVVFVEVKTATGKQSLVQRDFQKSVETHGGTYRLARSLEDITDLLDRVCVQCTM